MNEGHSTAIKKWRGSPTDQGRTRTATIWEKEEADETAQCRGTTAGFDSGCIRDQLINQPANISP